MTGERIVFCVLAIIALCFPMKAKAQALPELPSATVTELHLVNQQAGDLAFNMNGVKLPNGASSLLILNGIYKTMQAYNEWVGGEDYLIQQAYYMEKQNMPAWLAQYSGDYIFWEISFFGDHINMITDTSGNLVLNPNGKKALNVMIDENMDQAVKIYKAENNNSVQNLNIPQNSNFSTNDVLDLPRPYFSGKSLYFTIFIEGSPHLIQVEDFTNTVIACHADQSYFVSFPFFYVLDNSHGLTFIDHTTSQTLQTVTHGGRLLSNNASVNVTTFVINGNSGASLGHAKWYLPGAYMFSGWGSFTVYVADNKMINGYGYAGNSYNFLYTPGGGGMLSPSGLNYSAMFMASEDGQAVEGQISRLPIVGTPISADSITTISDAIAEIEPVTDPVTGIEIIEIPQNFPLPENIPLEEVPAPNPIPGGIEDFPQSDPEIAPPYDPSFDPSTTPTEDTLPDSAEQIQPMEELQLVTGLQNRFPFSIPWDIYNAFKMLQAEREIPHWEWEMNVNLPGGQVFTHTFILDLEFIDPVVNLFRDLFLLAFILGLAIYSYNKFFGGGA